MTLVIMLMLMMMAMMLLPFGQAAQVLGLFAHPGKSHFDFFRPMLLGLAQRGHNVSVYSYFPNKKPVVNYTDYVFEGMPVLTDVVDLQNFENEFRLLGLPYKIPTYFMLHDWGLRACKVAFNSPHLVNLLQSKIHYDVILMEHFSNDCMAAVAHLVGAPVIALSSCAIMPWHYQRMGTPFLNAIMPMNFLPYDDQMGLISRVNNFLHFHIINQLYNFITQSATDELIKERLGPDLPPVNEIVKNTRLMIINQHYALTGARPYAPNVIEVGGLQVGEQQKLPEELQRLLSTGAAKLGVIYISWGSMINTATLPQQKLKELFRLIDLMPDYSFVMRWSNQLQMLEKPRNLFTFQWLPQRDILCHPNVKAFLTHGGLLGTTEAVHCGVPMLVTPFYGDQFLNAAAIAQRRFGIIVGFANFNALQLQKALRTLLTPEFSEHVRHSTAAFRQRPQAPMHLAMWWIEHVIETGGAPLVQSAAKHINWFIMNSFDVYLILLTIALVPFACLWLLFRLISRLARRRPSKVKKQ